MISLRKTADNCSPSQGEEDEEQKDDDEEKQHEE